MSFETLWNNDIRLVDPEPSVDWFDKRRAFAEIVYRAALAEKSAPQDKSTCPHGHPIWALATRKLALSEIPSNALNDGCSEGERQVCSWCEAVRQVEADHAALVSRLKKMAAGLISGGHVAVANLIEAALEEGKT